MKKLLYDVNQNESNDNEYAQRQPYFQRQSRNRYVNVNRVVNNSLGGDESAGWDESGYEPEIATPSIVMPWERFDFKGNLHYTRLAAFGSSIQLVYEAGTSHTGWWALICEAPDQSFGLNWWLTNAGTEDSVKNCIPTTVSFFLQIFVSNFFVVLGGPQHPFKLGFVTLANKEPVFVEATSVNYSAVDHSYVLLPTIWVAV